MPTEGIELREYTAEELYDMDYQQLVNIAKEMGVKYQGIPKPRLAMILGGAPEDSVNFDDSEGLTEKDMETMKADGKQLPGPRVWHKDDDSAVWRILEKNPVAFYNTDLTDKHARTVHLFNKKKVTCVCGTTFRMEREYEDPKTNVRKTEPVDIKFCPGCQRKYITHDTNKVPEVAV